MSAARILARMQARCAACTAHHNQAVKVRRAEFTRFMDTRERAQRARQD